MAKPIKSPSFYLQVIAIISIFISFFFNPTLSLHRPLSDCLTRHKLTNFSLESSPHFHHLLKFSLQNLRAAGDSTPKPTAVILPESKDHLIHAVACCRESSLEIVIRCGGHSYEGLSSVPRGKNPFVIIDMMNLNGVRVDLESETAWVEGGATLGELFSAIAEHSEVHGFPAGLGPTVGVSGHIGGGGIGLMGRKYGLAADNVVDLVLIDNLGRELGRANMEEDVFWAVRGGGGGNWGVVYAWKVKLVHVPPKVTSFRVSKLGSIHELAKVIYKWQFVGPILDDGFHLSIYLSSNPNNEVVLTFFGFYLGPKIEATWIIKYYFPESDISEEEYLEMSWIESVLYFSGLPDGTTVQDLKLRNWVARYTKVKSDYVKKSISLEGLEGLLERVKLEPNGLVILDPYGGIMDRINNDSIPFPHRKGNLYNILYGAFWDEEKEGDQCLSWVRGIYRYMTPFVTSNPRAAYVNYVDLDLGALDFSMDSYIAKFDDSDVVKARAWGEKYFLGNYERLVKAKTKIDPQNVFNHRQGIPPSLVTIHDEL